MFYTLFASHVVVCLSSYVFAKYRIRLRLRSRLPSLRSTSTDLVGSADQICSISNDLGASSQEQLDSLGVTSSASHEIRSMVQSTRENATQLHSEARLLGDMTEKGSQVISRMVASSGEIKRGAESFGTETEESLGQLFRALGVIQEIAQKTQMINGIVFQTKLLSFNASVEAARAGDAGKGFAVVAEEVGQLAQMSGKASNEITEIVESSVAVVRSAIESTKAKIAFLAEQTVSRGEAGFREANECAKIFGEMAGKIDQITKMVEQVSSASQEQAIGVSQLDESIQSLKEIADRNRLVASQTSEYGREFESQTRSLAEGIRALAAVDPGSERGRKRLEGFVWNDKLVLGVDKMDDEHRELVSRINALVAVLDDPIARSESDRLLSAFNSLAEYTIHHFSDEEAYLAQIGYPQAGPHHKIHEKLLAQVAKYGEDLKAGRLNDEKLISFLKNWLISHIMGVDMQYAAHARSQKGAKGKSRKVA